MDIKGLCAKDLMQHDVRTVSEAASLRDAAKTMRDRGVSSLVVEQNDEQDAVGIVTRKDIIEGLVSLQMGGIALLVKDVMTKPAVTVTPMLSIHHCLQMMRMAGVRRLPVIKDDKVVGVLSNTDVFKHLAAGID